MNDPLTLLVDAFWRSYLDRLPETEQDREYFEAFQFGAGREMANQLARLVLDGIKTATSDLIWHIDSQHKPRWSVGDEHVLLDGAWSPVAVIQTKELETRRFCDIDEAFAFDYGEGDRTLPWWRKHMFDWYATECREIGLEPTEDMPLLCERFEVVYAPNRVPLI